MQSSDVHYMRCREETGFCNILRSMPEKRDEQRRALGFEWSSVGQ